MALFKFRKKTTRSTRAHRTARRGGDIQKLHIKVNSPRIVWLQIISGVKKGIITAIILAILGGIGWGGYRGVQHAFIDNEKYKLQEIKLKTNGHLDHARVVSVAAIDLDASIFAIDAMEVQNRLNALPEVIDCEVKHRLPGTLKINITERVPVVWIESQQLNFPGRKKGGILADKDGITFPCEGALWQTSQDLPVIVIQKSSTQAFNHGNKMKHSDAFRALHLIHLFNQETIRSEWMPERVILLNDYSMKATCNNGTQAIFGMYDHERQISDFIKISNHTRETNRSINHVNLIPKKNIPVKFVGGPVLVQPLQQPESVSPHDRQIQSILDRN